MNELKVYLRQELERQVLEVGGEDGYNTYRTVRQSRDGKYILGMKDGYVDASGKKEKWVKGETVLIGSDEREIALSGSGNKLVNPQIHFEKRISRPQGGDVNTNGDAVIVDWTDSNTSSRVKMYDPNGTMRFSKNFDANTESAAISPDGKIVVSVLPPWNKIYLYSPKGEEIWSRDRPQGFNSIENIDFGPEGETIILSDFNRESTFRMSIEGDLLEEGRKKDFHGRLSEYYNAFRDKKFEEVIELFDNLIEDANSNRANIRAIYDRVAEAHYRLDKYKESIKYWKKAYDAGDLSESKIKKMRKPFRALLRNKEDYEEKYVGEQWDYFEDNFGDFISENDKKKLSELKKVELEEKKTPVKEYSLEQKTGVFKRLNEDSFILKNGGIGYDPQLLKAYSKDFDLLWEEEFERQIREVISLSEGFVVYCADYKGIGYSELFYFDREFKEKNKMEFDGRLKIDSAGGDAVPVWDDEGLLYVFGENTRKVENFFGGWEDEIEVNSKYQDRGRDTPDDVPFEISISFGEVPNEQALRDTSAWDNLLFFGYGQNLICFELREQGLTYLWHRDFEDTNWVNWVHCEDERLFIGRHSGEILIYPIERRFDELDTIAEIDSGFEFINKWNITFTSTESKWVFGGREKIAVLEGKKLERISTECRSNPILFSGTKRFGFTCGGKLDVYSENLENKFSRRYPSKVRGLILEGEIWTSESNLQKFSLE